MKHYIKVFFAIISLSTKRYFENRWNTIGVLFNSIVSLLLTLVFVNIYFSFTKEIYGWNKYDVFLLIGFYRIISSIFSFLFLRSIYHIPEYIRNGEMDIFLTKPISSQFYVSFRLIRSYELLSLVSGVILVFYVLSRSQQVLLLNNWIFLSISLISGLIILYSIHFIIATLSFWTIRFTALPDLYEIISESLSIPVDLMGKTMSFILTFIIPFGFVVTVPTKLFLNKESVYLIPLSLIFACILLYFSTWFWNFALKSYTSASS